MALPHQDDVPMVMDTFDQVREMCVFWTEGRMDYDALDDWPVERLYRFADSYIEAHTMDEPDT